MKKYTNMAFLLLSIASIAPAYGNGITINEDQDKQEIVAEPKKTDVVWYKRPEIRQRIEAACVISAFAGAFFGMWYMGAFKVLARPLNKESVKEQQTQQAHNRIEGVTVLGTITQTDGKNTTIITPRKKPVWVKQDSAGTWMKKDEESPWVLYDSTVLSAQ